MAKSKINRSEVIRDTSKKHPGLKPKALAEIIKTQTGESIPPTYISMILSNAKKRKVGKRGRPRLNKTGMGKSTSSAASQAKSLGGVNIESLIIAKKFISEMGGIDEAKAAVSAMAKLLAQ